MLSYMTYAATLCFITCVMLYNMFHVMYMCHVMLYNMCHVILYNISSQQNTTHENMLYKMRHVMLYNICHVMLCNICLEVGAYSRLGAY